MYKLTFVNYSEVNNCSSYMECIKLIDTTDGVYRNEEAEEMAKEYMKELSLTDYVVVDSLINNYRIKDDNAKSAEDIKEDCGYRILFSKDIDGFHKIKNASSTNQFWDDAENFISYGPNLFDDITGILYPIYNEEYVAVYVSEGGRMRLA